MFFEETLCSEVTTEITKIYLMTHESSDFQLIFIQNHEKPFQCAAFM